MNDADMEKAYYAISRESAKYYEQAKKTWKKPTTKDVDVPFTMRESMFRLTGSYYGEGDQASQKLYDLKDAEEYADYLADYLKVEFNGFATPHANDLDDYMDPALSVPLVTPWLENPQNLYDTDGGALTAAEIQAGKKSTTLLGKPTDKSRLALIEFLERVQKQIPTAIGGDKIKKGTVALMAWYKLSAIQFAQLISLTTGFRPYFTFYILEQAAAGTGTQWVYGNMSRMWYITIENLKEERQITRKKLFVNKAVEILKEQGKPQAALALLANKNPQNSLNHWRFT